MSPNYTAEVPIGYFCEYPSTENCVKVNANIPVGCSNHAQYIVLCTVVAYFCGFLLVLLQLVKKRKR